MCVYVCIYIHTYIHIYIYIYISHLHNKPNIYRYASLQRLAKDRKQRLEESKKRFALSRETNELKHWISDKVNIYVKIKIFYYFIGGICEL